MWIDQETTSSKPRRSLRKSTSKTKSKPTNTSTKEGGGLSSVLQLFASEATAPEPKRKPRLSRRASTYTDVMLTVVDTGDTTVVPLSSLYDELLDHLLPEKSDVIENSIRSMIANSVTIEEEVKRNLLSHLRSSRYRIIHTDPESCIDKECTDTVLSRYLSFCNRSNLTPRLYVHFPSVLASPHAA